MANHRKYASEEEKKAAYKERYKERRKIWEKNSRERKLQESGREGTKNPCKHKRLNYEGLKVDIGTMDRTRLDTAYIEIVAIISYTDDDKSLEKFGTDVKKTFNEWLFNQTMWDKRNRIALMDYAKPNPKHKGLHKTLTWQFHIRRDALTDWNDTVENLMPLVEAILDEIKKTCEVTGLKLEKWAPNSKGSAAAADVPLTTNAAEED